MADAADDLEAPGDLLVVQIGTQVLVVDQAGNVYDYPTTGPAPDCEGVEACWGFSPPEGTAGVVIIEGSDVASGRVFEGRAAP